MIGDKIVNAVSNAGSTVGYYMGQCGQILDQASGQAFSNPGKLYTDLSTGTLDALSKKTAATVVTAGIIIVPAILAVGLAIKAYNLDMMASSIWREAHKGYRDPDYIEKQDKKIADLHAQGRNRFVAAACSLIVSAALLYMTASELRQSGSILATQLVK